MSIDDKLREILKAASISGRYGDTQEATYQELTAQIKQAFADEGFKKVIDVSPDIALWGGKRLMTGEKWYYRFDNQLKGLISRGDGETWMGWGCDEVEAAAKRATEIE